MAATNHLPNEANNNEDPFISSHSHGHPSPHRYASFDNKVFSLYNSGSPAQARRALEAHLKDTERRIHDASKLGNTLLQQRKDLAARLKDVEQSASEDISPELQKKLDQLEKDYSEIGKESARTFLPKSRIVSTDFSDATRSPAVFTSEAPRPSPSKPTANSRRQRNQPTNRVHDIEFATEISTSLLAQVRQLQAVLAEKENVLKDTTAQKAELESEMASLTSRLRTLDESEQKFKDENWNLETQLQELTAALKQATDKEQRLNHLHKSAQAEKDAAERELEDLKAAHGKLTDDHESVKKHHEAELFTLRRDVNNHESTRAALMKKVDELTSQNTQLAKAVAARWNQNSESSERDLALANEHAANDVETPDVSPQNSPIKPTPRHGMLETETLKSSLTHAHRMIQNLKNNIHREKTEKFELKRMLQDARDELENKRGDGGAGALGQNKKRRSEDNGVKFRKGVRPEKLGATRTTQHEIIMDEEDWEDQSIESPSRLTPRNISIGTAPLSHPVFSAVDSTDDFETANERDATDNFETADDRGLTTENEDAFQTGAETLDGNSSDDLTETETSTQTVQRPVSRPTSSRSRPSPYATNKAENRLSFMSTASNSDDEYEDVSTPVQSSQPKYKLRLSRGRDSDSARNSGNFASDSAESPASQISNSSRPPITFGQSLSAELDGLSDENDSGAETPGQTEIESVRSSPEAFKHSVTSDETVVMNGEEKAPMIDSGMMTEPWEPKSRSTVGAAAGVVGTALAGVAGFALGHFTSDDKEQENKAATPVAERAVPSEEPQIPGQFVESESPAITSPKEFVPDVEPKVLATPEMKRELAGIVSQHIEPATPAAKQPGSFSMATFAIAQTEPIVTAPAVKEPEQFAISSFATSHTEPVAIVETPRESGKCAISNFAASHTEPVAIVETTKELENFTISQYSSTHTEPVVPVQEVKSPEVFSLANFSPTHTEPVEAVREPEQFAISPFKVAHTEPVIHDAPSPEQLSFGITPLASTHTEPLPVTPAEEKEIDWGYGFSPLSTQHWEPVEFPKRTSSRRADLLYLQSGDFVPELQGNAISELDAATPGSSYFGHVPDTVFPPRSSSRDGATQPRLFGGAKGVNLDEPTLVFADENVSTPQIESDSLFRQPFAEVSNNVGSSNRSVLSDESRPSVKRTKTSETGTQTMVSSDEIDKMMRRKTPVLIPSLHFNEPSPAKPDDSPRRSSETPTTSDATGAKGPRRPASAGSMRKQTASSPPLPTDHTQRIAAAANANLSPSMGPPVMPASAYGKPSSSLRSRTPSLSKSVQSGRGTMSRPLAPIPARVETMSPTTRASSISSFASEVDERFQMHRNGVLYPEDLVPSTDPRMIQAITQTMIGEYLWKYTRKAGRSEISATRHRRFFWVHPYTRTLYWSEHDPSTMGKQQMKAKSVAIESVRVINDDNAYPPGLHRKSLVIVTPGREIVFTAPTAQRHDTWFNALSYLLLRTGAERDQNPNEDMTREEVDEFNPQLRSTSRNTARTRMSLSSYNSRTTHNSSPQRPHATEVPSLAQRQSYATMSHRRNPAAAPGSSDGSNNSGRMSIMGGLFKSPGGSMRGSFSSRRSKSAMSTRRPIESTIYDASVIEDSAEDLRKVIEGQERQADRLENVRACCDGKHDVGSLSRSTGRHTVGALKHTHSHPAPEKTGTVSSRP